MNTLTNISNKYPSDLVTLREVGLRDGLQMVKSFPTTAAKQDWVKREFEAGVRHFEVGSFLPAKRFPQFADVKQMIQTVAELNDAYSSVLALNERGATEAFETEVDEIVCVVSATEEHSQANMRRSRQDAVELVRKVVELRDRAGHGAIINVGLAMSFGCSIAGAVSQSEVLNLAQACFEAGADIVGIADTVGYAGPDQVGKLSAAMKNLCGGLPFGVHLHDTRGMAIANASAALDAGARILDGSLGGLGGCPFAPGATGNVVIEDLVFLCETKGFRTGIDLQSLTAVRAIPGAQMPDEQLYGALAKAGVPKRMEWQH
jgi:hydroxymethylglutaryl-CoA lyase